MSDTNTAGSDFKEIRDWMTEIEASKKRDKDWRAEAKANYERYESEKSTAIEDTMSFAGPSGEGSFNILYSNTCILQPALYSSTPQPDVRRRFRDEDKLGKLAAEVIERSLEYSISAYSFDDEISDAVFDMLMCGRGSARVKYDPTITQETITAQDGTEQTFDRLTDERTICELVPWDKWGVLGKAKRWAEVGAIYFEHEFTKDDLVEKFGEEMAGNVKMDELPDDMKEGKADADVEHLKTAKVYEVWDKDTKRVLFFAPTYKERYLLTANDPMKLAGFWPMPRPMYYVWTTKSLVPVPLTRLYHRQIRELEQITVRISKTVDAMRVRGAYPSSIPELATIAQSGDNDFVPIENMAQALASPGGLERAIWTWPIEKLPGVLQGLYQARDQVKQSVYEIIGISDILRGASKASETLGAQKIKAQTGSLRISKAQKEVARFVRDLLRLKAEVMVDKYSADTFAKMTNLDLPMPEQVAMAQQIAQQAQATGQQPPPVVDKVMGKPSWNDVMQLLKDDALRSYRIDIETDSTVADQIDKDMSGFAEVLTAIGQVVQGAAPAVQSGIIPADAVIEIILAISRKARLGSAIEDAIEEHRGEGIPMLQQLGQQVQQIGQQVQHLTQIAQAAGAPATPPQAGPPAPPGGPQ